MAGEVIDHPLPNQFVVGVHYDEPGPAPAPPPPGGETAFYDPGDFTVAEVQTYVTDHPAERAAVLAAEEAGKARSTLIEWLEAQ